jgi:muramoyltetrapeptide carboxypeptidase
VVAPGFAVRRPALETGVAELRRLGYRVRLGDHVLARDGYLAGGDEARGSDLAAMLTDPEVRAVWFARGGFGTARLLDHLPWRALRARAKPLIGYSDLTALFGCYAERTGYPCLYGPVAVELGDRTAYDVRSLRRLLAGKRISMSLRPGQVLAGGRARGALAGGNLTVLAHLCGTPHAPRLAGRVLFLEDVGEETYRIDRALTQLRAARALHGVSGVLLGEFRVPARRGFPPDRELRAVFEEAFLPLGVPVVAGLPAGHRPGKWTLPLGGAVEIDTAARRLRFAP